MKKITAGFTLIELLMTIAIIGILASILMPRLQSARDRGADALIKTNLNSIPSQAAIVFDNTGDYDGVCGDATIINSLESASEKTTGVTTNQECNDSSSAWAAAVQLRRENQVAADSGVDYWCTDSSGQAQLRDDPLVDGVDLAC